MNDLFFHCENSSSLVRHQPQHFSGSYLLANTSTSVTHQPEHFSGSYLLTNTPTSVFFNCERMTTSLFKYHCALREDGTTVITYEEFLEDLLEQIFDIIENEPAVFPFRFIFITVNNSRTIIAQLFVLRNIKRYKVISSVKISLFWSNVIDKSLFHIFRLFFPRKVRLLIIVPEGILFQNREIPTSQTWTISHDVTMTSSYLKNSFSAWKNWINAAISPNSKFRY